MQATGDARVAEDETTAAVVHIRQGVSADVIRIVDVRGVRAPMLRVWRGSVPYVLRTQSEKLLCSGTDKAFRAAITSSLTDDTFITNISGDFNMQVRRRRLRHGLALNACAGQPLLHRGYGS